MARTAGVHSDSGGRAGQGISSGGVRLGRYDHHCGAARQALVLARGQHPAAAHPLRQVQQGQASSHAGAAGACHPDCARSTTVRACVGQHAACAAAVHNAADQHAPADGRVRRGQDQGGLGHRPQTRLRGAGARVGGRADDATVAAAGRQHRQAATPKRAGCGRTAPASGRAHLSSGLSAATAVLPPGVGCDGVRCSQGCAQRNGTG